MPRKPRCVVIAGPNGAGKTTFARAYLPKVGITYFVNADIIASGLSPFDPQLAALPAGRMFLAEIERLASTNVDFAFETTLSGLGHFGRFKAMKAAGYRVEIIFLKLSSPALAIRRVAGRVRQGGHSVPPKDILRRFGRGWNNFVRSYRLAVDSWTVYDNSGAASILIEKSQ